MATAAVPLGGTSATTPSRNVSDEEKRWLVVGICLHKILTPALRKALSSEIPKWYNTLVKPPVEIDKQTYGKFVKNLPLSTIKLNYDSINNNTVHKSPKLYDYAVKDPLSLAKLFVKPFMASFAAFDYTMDTSAVLSVMCEAQPFIVRGADGLARKVRSDIRNEWAHCDFSKWTEPNFQSAIKDMESLVKKAGLTAVEEKCVLDDLNVRRKNVKELCFGKPLDKELLKFVQTEVAELENAYKKLNADAYNTEFVLKRLADISSGLQDQVNELKKSQARTELKMLQLCASQNDLRERYNSNTRDIQALRSERFYKSEIEDVYVFHAPDTFTWFTGRTRQVEEIKVILKTNKQLTQSPARKAAICGLGGSGKTSLAVEYAHRMKDHYQGGVFWFSGEDEKKLENSVNNLALSIGTFVSNSFDITLSQTLARISCIQKPWLVIIDNMDELQLSPKIRKLLSGSWQKKCNGHIIVTTRRKPSTFVNDVQVQEMKNNCCLELQCFDVDDAMDFLYCRTGISRNEDTEAAACRLFEELGGLPLALEQAAAYIKSLGCSFSSYLETYKTKRLALLDQQRINPVSEYSSPERLAVQTTWLLNIDHIRQNSEGRNAIRFLNACLFFNRNEIQEDLINVGQPPVRDEHFRSFVGTSLGKYQIFKLLTDFSLFKQSSSRNLQVHRLVLDVIRESLTPSEQEESFLDAVRLLHYSLSKAYSPDELLSSVADRGNNLVDYTNPSLFFLWRTLCLHAGEIEKNLKDFLLNQYKMQWTVFFPETAHVVYQHALYLSAFCRHEEAMQAMNFAVKILDWSPEDENEHLPSKPLTPLFPHAFPLPEFIRRHIQYCSKTPSGYSHNTEERVDAPVEVEDVEIDKLREKGNELFREGRFEEAVKVYSSVINRKKKLQFLDPRFFSNRASAYLRLQLYEKALKDAKAYISRCPKCWKGYARKALALHGLDDELGAELAACQTYNLARDVFSKYQPFEKFSYLKKCFRFCYSNMDLLQALNIPAMPPGKTVIFLYAGTYEITEHTAFNNRIVLGCDENTRIQVRFKNDSKACVLSKCILANLSFVFDQGITSLLPTSRTLIYNCSISSRNLKYPSLHVSGETKVDKCDFRSCGAGGILCVSGIVKVENCTFSNNGKAGLEVCDGGTLVAENVHSYNNRQGLLVGPEAKKCILTNSQISCNTGEGIFVFDCGHAHIELSNNSIFHNDHFGISVRSSSALITENRVFENSWWGIWLQSNSYCRISENEVLGNRLGGIRIGKRPSGCKPSDVEYNKINNNGGPGLIQNINAFDINISFGETIASKVTPYQCNVPVLPSALEKTLVSARCCGNEIHRNEVKYTQARRNNPPNVTTFCSFCRKKGRLGKCSKCYVAEYCGKACQTKHWKRHKKVCKSLLEQSSILLTSTERLGASQSKAKNMVCNLHHHNLADVGPNHSKPPPKNGARFIVKVQQTYDIWDFTLVSLIIYDQSLTIHESFTSAQVQNLIRDLGAICESKYIEKKLFMWAAYTENKIIRLFTNDFPPYQAW